MPLQTQGTLSFSDICNEIGVPTPATQEVSLAELFTNANTDGNSFNQFYVDQHKKGGIIKRDSTTLSDLPHSQLEWYGYGGVRVLSGSQGNRLDGIDFYISSHYVYETISGFTLTDVNAVLNNRNNFEGNDWLTYFDLGQPGAPDVNSVGADALVQNKSIPTSAQPYGTRFESTQTRLFNWTFTNDSTGIEYTSSSFSNDKSFFRVVNWIPLGTYYGFDILPSAPNSPTNSIFCYVWPNTGIISYVGNWGARVTFQRERPGLPGQFFTNSTASSPEDFIQIDSISATNTGSFRGEPPTNGSYYYNDTYNGVTHTNKIFVHPNTKALELNNIFYPSRVMATIKRGSIYKVTFEGIKTASSIPFDPNVVPHNNASGYEVLYMRL